MASHARARVFGPVLALSALTALLAPAPAAAQAPTTRPAPARPTPARPASPSCVLNSFATGVVKAVIDGRSFVLDDGRESGGTIYVNFGRRWSEDFTVSVAKRNERMFTAAGVEPKSLAGHRVEVRGWIEERGGPLIDAVTSHTLR